MTKFKTKNTLVKTKLARLAGTAALAFSIGMANILPAFAAIENTATAKGTFSTTGDTVSNADSVSVPVIELAPKLTTVISVSAPTTDKGVDTNVTGAADTITLTYTMTNDGNVTLTGVTPDFTDLPKFGGQTGTGSYGPPSLVNGTGTLAPTESLVYEVVYTLTDDDVINANNGTTPEIAVPAKATGTLPNTDLYTETQTATLDASSPWPSTYTIPDNPSLVLDKTYVLDEGQTGADGVAAVGETIIYTYTVKNDGNVALTNVNIKDVHEGAELALGTNIKSDALVDDGPYSGPGYDPKVLSTDGTPNDGVWDVLQPGAIITFTYTHTVTQAEVDAQ